MSQTRWACPNGCKAVLGPTRPRALNTCRFCLSCSEKSSNSMLVKRVPVTLLKREEKEREARAKQRKREAEERDAAKRKQLQRDAVEYSVILEGRSRGTFDQLAGKGGALAVIRELGSSENVELLRLQHGVIWKGQFDEVVSKTGEITRRLRAWIKPSGIVVSALDDLFSSNSVTYFAKVHARNR